MKGCVMRRLKDGVVGLWCRGEEGLGLIDMVKMMRSEWDGTWATGEEKQTVGYFMRCRGFPSV